MEEPQLHFSQKSLRKKVYYLHRNRSLKITRLGERAKSHPLYPPPHQGKCNERNFFKTKCSRNVSNTGYLAFGAFCSKDGASPKLPSAEVDSVPVVCAVSTSHPCILSPCAVSTSHLLGWQRCTNLKEKTKLSLARWKTLTIIDSHLPHKGMLLNDTEGNSLHFSSLYWETITYKFSFYPQYMSTQFCHTCCLQHYTSPPCQERLQGEVFSAFQWPALDNTGECFPRN